jgi:molybdopterin molybdotransferase
MSVDDALERVLAAFRPTAAETVPLDQALGRFTAAPVLASSTNPPFDASAMDGYAARAADLESLPATLRVVGESAAGHPFSGSINPGEAVRIFTGASVPDGANCIIIQENAERQETADGLFISTEQALPAGKHIRLKGEDFRQGQRLLDAGIRITPAHVALMGAADLGAVSVRQKPRVAILSNGDELVEPGSLRKTGQIPASNAIALKALIEENGGEAQDLGIARDNISSIQDYAARATGFDLFITIGGASVGDHDLIQKALQPIGLDVDFWKIAMRPGKPLIFGRLSDTPMLGLPGNPVSALMCSLLFVVPALRQMLGAPAPVTRTMRARLDVPLGPNGPRQAYLRAKLRHGEDGTLSVAPLKTQDSAYLSPLADADALIIRPPHAGPCETGDLVDVLPLDALNRHP